MSIIARLIPGMADLDQTPADYLQLRFEQVGVDEDLQREVVRSQVSAWTEQVLAQGNVPTLEGFIEFYPEWHGERFIDLIEAVIERLKAL